MGDSMYIKDFYNDENFINHKVTLITSNSMNVISNSIFVAIRGYNVNGIDYIDDAITFGAKSIIYDQDIEIKKIENINYIKVIDSKVELAKLLNYFYRKFKKPKMIAITGTNGKTSTTSYIYQLLKYKHKNINLLLVGTGYIKSFYKNNEYIKKTKNTTIEIDKLYLSIYEHKYDYVILEASSQGIEEGRLLGLEFDVIGFTNITQDHLDYHITMDNYANAKSKIIYYLKKDGILLLNDNINYFDKLKKISIANLKLYSINNSNVNYYLSNIQYNNNLIEFNFNTKKGIYFIQTNLLGTFNLENIILALAVLDNLFNKIDDFIPYIKNLKVAKGRMNLYKLNNFYVLIDFAHTPDGIEKVLLDMNRSNYKQIITILGAGGNKDKEKRPIMGNIATKNSNKVIFTEDNSRSEKINVIINDLIKNISINNYEIIYERKEAIDYALSISKENDIVVILGKGAEEYIERDEFIEFSDIDYIESLGGIRING